MTTGTLNGGAIHATHIDPIEAEADKTRSIGDFIRTLARIEIGRGEDHRAAHDRMRQVYRSQYRKWGDAEHRALGLSTGTGGGYMLPRDLHNELLLGVSSVAIVRPRATVIPMTSEEMDVPVLSQAMVPTAGRSAFYSNMNLAWLGDGDELPEADPTFNVATLSAKTLGGYVAVPQKLVRSSAPAFDVMMRSIFAEAVSAIEDEAFLRGDGVGKPLGAITPFNLALIETAARGSGSAISFADVRKVWVRMPAASRRRAVWCVSTGAEEALLDAAGTANGIFLNQPDLPRVDPEHPDDSATYGILGRPVLSTEALPDLNTLGDFGLYDFSKYLIGDLDALEISVSEHFEFRANRLSVRLIHRVAGIPWSASPITLRDGTTTVSPFVALGPAEA